MPELPEVETIARYLREGSAGPDEPPGTILLKTAAAARVLWPRTLSTPSPEELNQVLPGQALQRIGRRGKYLLLGFDRHTLLIHLRMSGDLRVDTTASPVLIHDRFLLEFQDGARLAFNDPRKFGRVWLAADPAEVVGGLGPEPLEDGFTPEFLYSGLHQRSRQLKPLLLDQSFIAGLGNIYSDEALHLARLHPLQLSSRLSPAQASALWVAIRQVLNEGIRHHGASIDWVYRGGDFQNHFNVYGRTGQACRGCGAHIVRIVVGQRSTHFCPVCQPADA